jgi:hypothetical protein
VAGGPVFKLTPRGVGQADQLIELRHIFFLSTNCVDNSVEQRPTPEALSDHFRINDGLIKF